MKRFICLLVSVLVISVGACDFFPEEEIPSGENPTEPPSLPVITAPERGIDVTFEIYTINEQSSSTSYTIKVGRNGVDLMTSLTRTACSIPGVSLWTKTINLEEYDPYDHHSPYRIEIQSSGEGLAEGLGGLREPWYFSIGPHYSQLSVINEEKKQYRYRYVVRNWEYGESNSSFSVSGNLLGHGQPVSGEFDVSHSYEINDDNEAGDSAYLHQTIESAFLVPIPDLQFTLFENQMPCKTTMEFFFSSDFYQTASGYVIDYATAAQNPVYPLGNIELSPTRIIDFEWIHTFDRHTVPVPRTGRMADNYRVSGDSNVAAHFYNWLDDGRIDPEFYGNYHLDNDSDPDFNYNYCPYCKVFHLWGQELNKLNVSDWSSLVISADFGHEISDDHVLGTGDFYQVRTTEGGYAVMKITGIRDITAAEVDNLKAKSDQTPGPAPEIVPVDPKPEPPAHGINVQFEIYTIDEITNASTMVLEIGKGASASTERHDMTKVPSGLDGLTLWTKNINLTEYDPDTWDDLYWIQVYADGVLVNRAESNYWLNNLQPNYESFWNFDEGGKQFLYRRIIRSWTNQISTTPLEFRAQIYTHGNLAKGVIGLAYAQQFTDRHDSYQNWWLSEFNHFDDLGNFEYTVDYLQLYQDENDLPFQSIFELNVMIPFYRSYHTAVELESPSGLNVYDFGRIDLEPVKIVSFEWQYQDPTGNNRSNILSGKVLDEPVPWDNLRDHTYNFLGSGRLSYDDFQEFHCDSDETIDIVFWPDGGFSSHWDRGIKKLDITDWSQIDYTSPINDRVYFDNIQPGDFFLLECSDGGRAGIKITDIHPFSLDEIESLEAKRDTVAGSRPEKEELFAVPVPEDIPDTGGYVLFDITTLDDITDNSAGMTVKVIDTATANEVSVVLEPLKVKTDSSTCWQAWSLLPDLFTENYRIEFYNGTEKALGILGDSAPAYRLISTDQDLWLYNESAKQYSYKEVIRHWESTPAPEPIYFKGNLVSGGLPIEGSVNLFLYYHHGQIRWDSLWTGEADGSVFSMEVPSLRESFDRAEFEEGTLQIKMWSPFYHTIYQSHSYDDIKSEFLDSGDIEMTPNKILTFEWMYIESPERVSTLRTAQVNSCEGMSLWRNTQRENISAHFYNSFDDGRLSYDFTNYHLDNDRTVDFWFSRNDILYIPSYTDGGIRALDITSFEEFVMPENTQFQTGENLEMGRFYLIKTSQGDHALFRPVSKRDMTREEISHYLSLADTVPGQRPDFDFIDLDYTEYPPKPAEGINIKFSIYTIDSITDSTDISVGLTPYYSTEEDILPLQAVESGIPGVTLWEGWYNLTDTDTSGFGICDVSVYKNGSDKALLPGRSLINRYPWDISRNKTNLRSINSDLEAFEYISLIRYWQGSPLGEDVKVPVSAYSKEGAVLDQIRIEGAYQFNLQTHFYTDASTIEQSVDHQGNATLSDMVFMPDESSGPDLHRISFSVSAPYSLRSRFTLTIEDLQKRNFDQFNNLVMTNTSIIRFDYLYSENGYDFTGTPAHGALFMIEDSVIDRDSKDGLYTLLNDTNLLSDLKSYDIDGDSECDVYMEMSITGEWFSSPRNNTDHLNPDRWNQIMHENDILNRQWFGGSSTFTPGSVFLIKTTTGGYAQVKITAIEEMSDAELAPYR